VNRVSKRSRQRVNEEDQAAELKRNKKCSRNTFVLNWHLGPVREMRKKDRKKSKEEEYNNNPSWTNRKKSKQEEFHKPSWTSKKKSKGNILTSNWHLGQVPVTKRSARNLPAASLYSCSMVCSTSCPALSSVLKMPCEHKHNSLCTCALLVS